MDILINIAPVIIVLCIIGYQGWKLWKDGLFMALIQLGVSIASAVLAFLLTRLLLDPARVDLFGLGALIVDKVPEDFITVMPKLEAFLRALPTALAALFGFTIIFDVLRINIMKLICKLNERYHWSKHFLKFKTEKALTVLVGLLIAVVCMVPDLAILSGTLTFTGNMLYCAKTVTKQPFFTTMGDMIHTLQDSSLIRLCNSLGAEDLYFTLTTAERDGDSFSVGEELNGLSDSFVGLLPVFDTMNREGEPPSPEEIRQLPEVLGSSEDSLALTVGLARSYREDLGGSDSIKIISSLMGSTPQRFEEYLGQLDMETAQEDLTTFCEVAAILGDHGLIPESGELFDESALQDLSLITQIRSEFLKNKHLTDYFAIPSENTMRIH